MMRYLRILFLGMIVSGLLTGSAFAAILSNSAGNNFGTGSSVGNSYKIAYEVYSESAGVSTIANRGVIQISLGQNLNAQETANLVIPGTSAGGIDADFNSSGANFKWALIRVDSGPVYTVIGITPSAGLTTPNLPFSIIANASAGQTVLVWQWNDLNADGIVTLNEVVQGAGIYVRPGAGATCDNTKIVKVTFSTPHETTAAPVNFAYITPQFTGTGPAGGDILNAELNTDTDFRTFLLGSGPYVDSPTQIYDGSFINLNDISGDKKMWIAYASEGYIRFNVNSVVGEPNASLSLDGNYCVRDADSKVFSCSAYGTLVGNHNLSLQVDGYSTNKPTIWTLSNFGNLCVTSPPVVIGVWYGGLWLIFADVPPDYWAEIYISIIYSVGITVGCAQDDPGTPENERRYCPEDYVRREEMAAFIVRAVEGEPPLNYCDSGSLFPDVTLDMWSCRYIKRLRELEITTGYSDGRYGPYDFVPREQMAAFLVRAVEGEPPDNYCDSGSLFNDVTPDMWSCKYIKRLKELAITTGYTYGRYGPYDFVTRAQMAAFLARAFLGME
jgi:hypothetical protein